MKTGDKVICINSKPQDTLFASSTGLTLGNEYIIEGVNGREGLWIKNDDGVLQHYYSERFMLLDDMKAIVKRYEQN